MAQQYTGFIEQVGHKEGRGKRGPWHLYSLKIDGTWITLGFLDSAPAVQEGEYVTVQASVDERGNLAAVKGTLKRQKAPEGQATPAKQTASSGNRFDGTGISNRTNPEDAKRMSYSSARTAAIEVVTLLLEHDALPITTAKTAAGVPKRFDEITAAVDKLTVEYYNDGMSLRKTETVADAGVQDVKADGPLPGKGKKPAQVDGDDVPPEQEGDDDSDDDAVAF